MNRIRELFKSNTIILLFSMALTSVTILFLSISVHALELKLELVILPALTLMGGPFAALGFLIVEGIYLLAFGSRSPILNMTLLIVLFIGNVFLWKLWYSIMNRYGHEIPNFSSLYNIIKFFVTFFIYSVLVYFMLTGFVYTDSDMTYIFENMSMLFPLSIIFMIIGMHISLKYKIQPYIPKRRLNQFLPEKTYTIILISAIIIGLINYFVMDFFYSIIMNIITIALVIIYITKPLGKDCIVEDDIELNLFIKINSSLFILLLIMLLLTNLPIYLLLPAEYVTLYDIISNSAYVSLMFFTLLLIPVLVYMYYLEKNMVNPINKLSKSFSRKMNDQETHKKLRDELNSINVNNELKSLADSLLKMDDDLNAYTKQLVEVTSQKERFETEMTLAHDIQNSMIPKNFEEYNDGDQCEIWGLMEPAREVAGDFYDYFGIDEDNIGFVIGDVSGKGISAALIMVKAMTLIEDYALHFEDLSEVFYEVNNLLCEGNVENLFVTCWLGKLNFKTKKLSYVNAGHNPPLIKQNENFEYLDMDSGVVLAAMDDIPYETSEIQLKSGDAILLYTDGITEANYDYKEFYGEERLKNVINKHKNDDLETIINSVEKDMNDFCDNQEQFDDTTMFAIRLK